MSSQSHSQSRYSPSPHSYSLPNSIPPSPSPSNHSPSLASPLSSPRSKSPATPSGSLLAGVAVGVGVGKKAARRLSMGLGRKGSTNNTTPNLNTTNTNTSSFNPPSLGSGSGGPIARKKKITKSRGPRASAAAAAAASASGSGTSNRLTVGVVGEDGTISAGSSRPATGGSTFDDDETLSFQRQQELAFIDQQRQQPHHHSRGDTSASVSIASSSNDLLTESHPDLPTTSTLNTGTALSSTRADKRSSFFTDYPEFTSTALAASSLTQSPPAVPASLTNDPTSLYTGSAAPSSSSSSYSPPPSEQPPMGPGFGGEGRRKASFDLSGGGGGGGSPTSSSNHKRSFSFGGGKAGRKSMDVDRSAIVIGEEGEITGYEINRSPSGSGNNYSMKLSRGPSEISDGGSTYSDDINNNNNNNNNNVSASSSSSPSKEKRKSRRGSSILTTSAAALGSLVGKPLGGHNRESSNSARRSGSPSGGPEQALNALIGGGGGGGGGGDQQRQQQQRISTSYLYSTPNPNSNLSPISPSQTTPTAMNYRDPTFTQAAASAAAAGKRSSVISMSGFRKPPPKVDHGNDIDTEGTDGDSMRDVKDRDQEQEMINTPIGDSGDSAIPSTNNNNRVSTTTTTSASGHTRRASSSSNATTSSRRPAGARRMPSGPRELGGGGSISGGIPAPSSSVATGGDGNGYASEAARRSGDHSGSGNLRKEEQHAPRHRHRRERERTGSGSGQDVSEDEESNYSDDREERGSQPNSHPPPPLPPSVTHHHHHHHHHHRHNRSGSKSSSHSVSSSKHLSSSSHQRNSLQSQSQQQQHTGSHHHHRHTSSKSSVPSQPQSPNRTVGIVGLDQGGMAVVGLQQEQHQRQGEGEENAVPVDTEIERDAVNADEGGGEGENLENDPFADPSQSHPQSLQSTPYSQPDALISAHHMSNNTSTSSFSPSISAESSLSPGLAAGIEASVSAMTEPDSMVTSQSLSLEANQNDSYLDPAASSYGNISAPSVSFPDQPQRASSAAWSDTSRYSTQTFDNQSIRPQEDDTGSVYSRQSMAIGLGHMGAGFRGIQEEEGDPDHPQDNDANSVYSRHSVDVGPTTFREKGEMTETERKWRETLTSEKSLVADFELEKEGSSEKEGKDEERKRRTREDGEVSEVAKQLQEGSCEIKTRDGESRLSLQRSPELHLDLDTKTPMTRNSPLTHVDIPAPMPSPPLISMNSFESSSPVGGMLPPQFTSGAIQAEPEMDDDAIETLGDEPAAQLSSSLAASTARDSESPLGDDFVMVSDEGGEEYPRISRSRLSRHRREREESETTTTNDIGKIPEQAEETGKRKSDDMMDELEGMVAQALATSQEAQDAGRRAVDAWNVNKARNEHQHQPDVYLPPGPSSAPVSPPSQHVGIETEPPTEKDSIIATKRESMPATSAVPISTSPVSDVTQHWSSSKSLKPKIDTGSTSSLKDRNASLPSLPDAPPSKSVATPTSAYPATTASSYNNKTSRRQSRSAGGVRHSVSGAAPNRSVKEAQLMAFKNRNPWPSAMNYSDIKGLRSSGDRATAYASKINALIREDSGLQFWVRSCREGYGIRDQGSNSNSSSTIFSSPPVNNNPPLSHSHSREFSTGSEFPIRGDAYKARDLTQKGVAPNTLPTSVPYPGVLNLPKKANIVHTAPQPSSSTSARTGTGPPPALMNANRGGNFFSSLGRKASRRTTVSPLGVGGAPNKSAPSPTNTLSSASNLRPIQGGPRAPQPGLKSFSSGSDGDSRSPSPGNRAGSLRAAGSSAPAGVGQGQQQASPSSIQPPLPTSGSLGSTSGSSVLNGSNPSRPTLNNSRSSFAYSSVRGVNPTGNNGEGGGSGSNDGYEDKIDKLVDIIPQASRDVLRQYLVKANGDDLAVVGAYLDDERAGKV